MGLSKPVNSPILERIDDHDAPLICGGLPWSRISVVGVDSKKWQKLTELQGKHEVVKQEWLLVSWSQFYLSSVRPAGSFGSIGGKDSLSICTPLRSHSATQSMVQICRQEQTRKVWNTPRLISEVAFC